MRVAYPSRPSALPSVRIFRSAYRDSAAGMPSVTARTIRGVGLAAKESARNASAAPVKDEMETLPRRSRQGGVKDAENRSKAVIILSWF